MADKKITDLTGYTTPLDADVVPVVDVANDTTKKTTWSNIKATLKTYFDTLYTYTIPVKATGAEINTGTDDAKFATPKAIADSNIAFLSDIPTVPSKASGTDVDTGTDDTKYVTVKAINDSHNVPMVAPGTSGNVLTSNGTDWVSSAPTGSSAWTTISSGQLSSASATLMDVSSISTNYDSFRITIFWINDGSSSRDTWLRFNNDSGGNYYTQGLSVTGGTVSGSRETAQTKIRLHPGVTVMTGSSNRFTIEVSKSLTTAAGTVTFSGKVNNTTNTHIITGTGGWDDTSNKISRIQLICEDATTIYQAGSFYLLEGCII